MTRRCLLTLGTLSRVGFSTNFRVGHLLRRDFTHHGLSRAKLGGGVRSLLEQNFGRAGAREEQRANRPQVGILDPQGF